MEDLKYPVGKFNKDEPITTNRRKELIGEIEELPAKLRQAVESMNDIQLDTPYRPGGWTVRQVVHHLVDSHLNAYIRIKLGATETQPTIKPYEEKLWAELPDGKHGPIDMSLTLLDALHYRWTVFLRQLQPGDFDRTINHPVSGVMSLNVMVGLYAWHGRHHLAHITGLKKREKWS